jgi:hypothetical protein
VKLMVINVHEYIIKRIPYNQHSTILVTSSGASSNSACTTEKASNAPRSLGTVDAELAPAADGSATAAAAEDEDDDDDDDINDDVDDDDEEDDIDDDDVEEDDGDDAEVDG